MGAAAGRVALQDDAWLAQFPRLAQLLPQFFSLGHAAGIQGMRPAEFALEGGQVGGESFARKLRREHAAAGRIAGMERFGHGAEIAPDAAGPGRRNAQRHGNLPLVQAQQPGTGRRSTDHADRGSRMPAMFIVQRIDRAAQLANDFHPDRIGQDQVTARSTGSLGHRQRRREDRR